MPYYYHYIAIYIIFIVVLYIFYKYILFYFSYKRPKNLPMYVNKMDYNVDEIDGFLTPHECDLIIKMASSKMSDSHTYNNNKSLLNMSVRKSKTCVLYSIWNDWNDIVPSGLKSFENIVPSGLKGKEGNTKWIYKRLSKYLPMTENHSKEPLQVSLYEKGGYYREHYDSCVGSEDECRQMDEYYGPRLLTCLIYLNDDYEGGNTLFPIINKKIIPKKGKAIIFQDTDKHGSIINESLHTGTDVKNGRKWIATIWVKKLNRYYM